MLKEQAQLFRRIAVATDLVSIVAAFVLSYYVRSLSVDLSALTNYLWVLLVIGPVWVFLITRFRLYESLRTLLIMQIIISLVKVQAIGGIITSSVIFLVDHRLFSRGVLGYFLLFSFVLIGLEKTLFKLVLGYLRRQGYNTRNLLIVGSDGKAQEFVRLIEAHAGWGLRIVGFVQLTKESLLHGVAGYNVLGTVEDLIRVCRYYTVDEVVFCLPKSQMTEVEEYLHELGDMGVTARMVLDFYETKGFRRELSFFHGQVPILTFYSKPFDAGQLLLKRCLDIVGACVGLTITAALFPFIVLAIKLDSKGPLFFGQKRVGESGRIFKCWKFRSMYLDAEERKKELMHLNEMNGAIFKIRDDPRITKVGNFLRKTSLDELPQFWNVLRGEMSLVGTRPPTPDEVVKYENWHRKRICIKPGITGFWQVSGRNQIQDFDDVVRLDLEYIDKWSLWLDIKILFKTAWVVFAREGSC